MSQENDELPYLDQEDIDDHYDPANDVLGGASGPDPIAALRAHLPSLHDAHARAQQAGALPADTAPGSGATPEYPSRPVLPTQPSQSSHAASTKGDKPKAPLPQVTVGMFDSLTTKVETVISSSAKAYAATGALDKKIEKMHIEDRADLNTMALRIQALEESVNRLEKVNANLAKYQDFFSWFRTTFSGPGSPSADTPAPPPAVRHAPAPPDRADEATRVSRVIGDSGSSAAQAAPAPASPPPSAATRRVPKPRTL